MRDLVDIHRANIAKAGVTLAERIASATSDYSAEVAASEAALIISMDRRLQAFNGELLAIEDQRTADQKTTIPLPASNAAENAKNPD